ncbi:hypothetical protein AF41_02487 [Citrobacter sp. MGH 55]|nr:hypothetical protein AF41_02487 [Citrobacter sp. MGH 55]
MTTITRERLEWLSNISGRDDIEDIGGDEIRELARIALASLEAEPVAYTEKCEITNMQATGLYLRGFPNNSQGRDIALFTAPPAPVVPEEKRDEDGNTTSEFDHGWNACRAALLQGSQPVSNRDELPEEKGASLQLRNLIRRRHAEWSEKTFGNVGPIGPLKHLSKEALEAAAEPDDLSEWADMQFLLWDAQRRAGISDGEITAAMEEKLKVNMARQWPEPKDGEPRLHIKSDQRQEHM